MAVAQVDKRQSVADMWSMARQHDPQLTTYRAKRDQHSTPEPFGRIDIPATGQLFVVQQHAARHLHFDLRLEVNGVLKSWAVPKGPSDDPKDKRFAVETEDHPLDYADFEGEIPAGNYGAGHVIVWDRGRYTALKDFADGYAKGKLLFDLYGCKLSGRWTLVRLKTRASTGKEWLLIKEHDAYVAANGPSYEHGSILSGLTVAELENPKRKGAALRRAALRLNDTKPVSASGVPGKPMLASAGEASDRKGWLWELKYDGYRILAAKNRGEVTLFTRNGKVVSERFPEVCQVVAHLPVSECVIDGELVVNDAGGRPNFALMQQRARLANTHLIARAAVLQRATYYCFDLLQIQEIDLRDAPLKQRKQMLRRLLPSHSVLTYSEHVVAAGRETFAAARALGVEGVVGKRVNSRYRAGRSGDWVKVRAQRAGEFVVLGWSPTKSHASDIGAIALGEYRGGVLSYAGHAGSGLGQEVRADLVRRMKNIGRKTSPLSAGSKSVDKPTHWVRPNLVVEVSFTEYTPLGLLRHPSVVRVRDDKTATECVGGFDDVGGSLDGASSGPIDKVVVTNPDKIFFPDPNFTKADLVAYYRRIAPWIQPYLQDRPIVLTRFPDGVAGKSFYQRDVPDYVPDWIRRAALWSDSTQREINYFVVNSAEDLAYLANMGTLPIHVWHSRVADLEHPDWCVLDLDPKGAPFTDVVKLAQTIGDIAQEIGVPSYPKTSGASGLHVLLPLSGRLTHEQSRTLGELLARLVVDRHPDIATVARSVRARNKKVYVDYLQNGHGQLIAAPFCVRAEAAANVSMPLKWREVNAGLRNARYHIGNAVRRMQRLRLDPGRGVLTDEPDLERGLARLAEMLGQSGQD